MMARFRRILHPTDFSAASNRAFAVALAMAKQNRAALEIAHVLAPIRPVGEGFVSPKTYEALEAADRRAAQTRLDRLVARATTARVRARGLLLEGMPHEQIARSAKRADLVVMGTRGRTGLPRLFLGSVAERVLTLTPCPVLTVRGR
jgi:nucleotide-binding universal stress UspA family protein